MSNIKAKLKAIYSDLSMNVTHIYSRQNAHLAFDLVYHGVPAFKLKREQVFKGYPEALLIGDTRCGKTQIAKRLMAHYRLGQFASGEGASFAGLVGGAQKQFNKWMITWGRIPINDGRLLVIDEVTGLTTDDIGNMSRIRSEGIAEITKIATASTSAKTRLMWLANPRAHSVGHAGYGIELIKNLIGKDEDIARFDFAMVLANEDVAADLINDPVDRDVGHVYTSELCRALILWAWSRKPNQIIIRDDTYRACVDFSKLMLNKYSEDFPIVHRGEQKKKIAKCAVALACRLFSTEDGETVLVLPEHVEYIYEFLCSLYDAPKFAYDLWSSDRHKDTDNSDQEELYKLLDEMGGVDVMKSMLDTKQISVRFIEEHCQAFSKEEALGYLKALLRFRALTDYGNYYYKKPAFVKALHRYVESKRPVAEKEF